MTWSLQLVGGDITKGQGNSLAKAEGSSKVVQDLHTWIMTELGSNPHLPGYGSAITFEAGDRILLGGETLISVHEDRLELMTSEINRIIEEYQKRQLVRIKQDVISYNGKHTFGPGEIISSFNIEYEVLFDTLYIDINLTLLSGEETSIEVAYEN